MDPETPSEPSLEPLEPPPPPLQPFWRIETLATLVLPYLHPRRRTRVIYFCSVVVVLSMLKQADIFFRVQFITSSDSFFNVYLVKVGWGWSLALIIALRVCCLPLRLNWRHHLWNFIIRLAILTFFFYMLFQVVFPVIAECSGECVKEGVVSNLTDLNKRRCLKMKGHEFRAIDVSGHSFLMPYCILALMEESKELIYALNFGQFIRSSSSSPVLSGKNGISSTITSLSREEMKVFQRRYSLLMPLIVLATLVTVCFNVVWDVMLIVTTLFYHMFHEKVLGASFAIASWYFQYIIIFSVCDIL